jgi:hypothetical protein
MYLMVSALVTLLRVRSLTMPTVSQFGEGCRGMLLMTLVGAAVLWPMVRLSQARPERIGRSLAGDLVVLLVPMQAVIWPMPLLTRWSFEVTGAVAVCAASWTVLAAGVLACAYRAGDGARRWPWMALLSAGATVGPLARAWIGEASERGIDALRLASPVTGAWALTGAPSGLAPVMQWSEWVLALAPGAAGSGLWALAGRLAPGVGAGYSLRNTTTAE